jgi:hypothetical protein
MFIFRALESDELEEAMQEIENDKYLELDALSMELYKKCGMW